MNQVKAIKCSNYRRGDAAAKISFKIISLVHDNRLLPLFRDPAAILQSIGMKKGQKVLEVDCGPGFYTMAASKIVGSEGKVFALDVNPYAVDRVKEKVLDNNASNVRVMQANASESGLSESSIDLAFLFGLPRIVGGMKKLAAELGRVVRPGGTVVYQTRNKTLDLLVEIMKTAGFHQTGQDGRFISFARTRR